MRMEQELQAEKIRNLRRAEIEAEKLKESHYQFINTKRLYTLNQSDTYEVFNDDEYQESVAGDIDQLGITEDELDAQCDELFSVAPIDFKPRKGNEIDLLIQQAIREFNLTIPIVWIKEQLYLVGSSRSNLSIKRDKLMIKKGVSLEKFDEYVFRQQRNYQRTLVSYMIKTGESLEYVVEQLMSNKKIRGFEGSTRDYSPMRSTSPGGRSSGLSKLGTPGSRIGRTTLTASAKSRTSDVSPGEKRYREQRDRILGDLRSVLNPSKPTNGY